MGEQRKTNKVPRPEDIIAAFDREQAKAQELRRQHTERIRAARGHDRPARGKADDEPEYR